MAVKYFDFDATTRCFIAVKNKMVMDLTDVNLSFQTATDDVTTFDSSYVKSFLPTETSWTVDCTGVFSDTATGYLAYTGSTAANTLTGSTNGLLLLEQAKSRQLVTFVARIDASNVQRGSCIITDISPKFSQGKAGTYSLKLQGSSALVKSAT